DRLTTERYAVPSLLLMESAAAAAAREILPLLPNSPGGPDVIVLCGRGNNGGDGAALARQLCLLGANVTVVLFGKLEETKGDARVNFEIVRALDGGSAFRETGEPDTSSLNCFAGSPGVLFYYECTTPKEWGQVLYEEGLQPFDLIVDALLGTGLTRPVDGLYAEIVDFINDASYLQSSGEPSPVVALDLPSGLDADSGEPIGPAARADLTITFTAPKLANVLPPASTRGGRLVVADIGSPETLLDEAPSKLFLVEASDARAWLAKTRYTPESYKNTHGHALVVAGSRGMTGAAVLCAGAAMSAGAGLVTLAAPESAVPAIAARLMPEVMTAALKETEAGSVSADASEQLAALLKRASVVAVGPGLAREQESTRRFVREAVERRRTPVVIDADGLNALAPWPPELKGTAEAPLVLTPHEGEMLRLLGADDSSALAERTRAVAEFAAAQNLFVVLKGTRTLVAAPDGSVFVNPTGNAGLGTAGSGDTLTGIIAGFLAQEFAAKGPEPDARAALLAAVYVAGLAGDLAAGELGMRAMVASDVRKFLGAAVRALDPEGETP
ncbi:MAG TPA: NAD(P)H-hydrate dehydratase, partial [Pyrinomonadaceae bacterium]